LYKGIRVLQSCSVSDICPQPCKKAVPDLSCRSMRLLAFACAAMRRPVFSLTFPRAVPQQAHRTRCCRRQSAAGRLCAWTHRPWWGAQAAQLAPRSEQQERREHGAAGARAAFKRRTVVAVEHCLTARRPQGVSGLSGCMQAERGGAPRPHVQGRRDAAAAQAWPHPRTNANS
jgi:hypothetical protein